MSSILMVPHQTILSFMRLTFPSQVTSHLHLRHPRMRTYIVFALVTVGQTTLLCPTCLEDFFASQTASCLLTPSPRKERKGLKEKLLTLS